MKLLSMAQNRTSRRYFEEEIRHNDRSKLKLIQQLQQKVNFLSPQDEPTAQGENKADKISKSPKTSRRKVPAVPVRRSVTPPPQPPSREPSNFEKKLDQPKVKVDALSTRTKNPVSFSLSKSGQPFFECDIYFYQPLVSRAVGFREVTYDPVGNVTAMAKLNPERLPNHRFAHLASQGHSFCVKTRRRAKLIQTLLTRSKRMQPSWSVSRDSFPPPNTQILHGNISSEFLSPSCG